MACSAPKVPQHVQFWAFFVIEAARYASFATACRSIEEKYRAGGGRDMNTPPSWLICVLAGGMRL